MKVAVFRPDDERLERAVSMLESLGIEPVADPMLAVSPTGAAPRKDADYAILTSKTGVELAAESDWMPEGRVCAIGTATADTLCEAGYHVDHVPDEFSSAGLVTSLETEVAGRRVEVARSDHGSRVLTDGLAGAGAYVHETVLYELVRPPASGRSAELAADGSLAGALFTSSLTVKNFLAAASEREVRTAAIAGLNDAVVGAIGEPTRETAERAGIAVDIVPPAAEFGALARATVERLDGDDRPEV